MMSAFEKIDVSKIFVLEVNTQLKVSFAFLHRFSIFCFARTAVFTPSLATYAVH